MSRISVKQRALILGLATMGALIAVRVLSRDPVRMPVATPGSGLNFEPTPGERERLKKLASQVSPADPHFDSEASRAPENAKLFTYLAHTSKVRHVQLAALEAMAQAFGARSSRRAVPDDDVETTLVAELTAPDEEIRRLAWAALQAPLMVSQPRATLVATLAQLNAPRQRVEIRLRAILALDLLRPDRRSDSALLAFMEGLKDPDSFVVCAALAGIEHSYPAQSLGAAPQGTLPPIRELTTHQDAAVRGEALRTWLALEGATASKDLLISASALSHDPEPFVRAQALTVLGAGGLDSSAMGLLLSHARDTAVAQLHRPGPTQDLDLRLQVPGRRTVAEAALFAVAQLSERFGTERLMLPIGGPSTTDAALEQAAQTASKWWTSQAK